MATDQDAKNLKKHRKNCKTALVSVCLFCQVGGSDRYVRKEGQWILNNNKKNNKQQKNKKKNKTTTRTKQEKNNNKTITTNNNKQQQQQQQKLDIQQRRHL